MGAAWHGIILGKSSARCSSSHPVDCACDVGGRGASAYERFVFRIASGRRCRRPSNLGWRIRPDWRRWRVRFRLVPAGRMVSTSAKRLVERMTPRMAGGTYAANLSRRRRDCRPNPEGCLVLMRAAERHHRTLPPNPAGAIFGCQSSWHRVGNRCRQQKNGAG